MTVPVTHFSIIFIILNHIEHVSPRYCAHAQVAGVTGQKRALLRGLPRISIKTLAWMMLYGNCSTKRPCASEGGRGGVV